jgi:hypothetical protein
MTPANREHGSTTGAHDGYYGKTSRQENDCAPETCEEVRRKESRREESQRKKGRDDCAAWRQRQDSAAQGGGETAAGGKGEDRNTRIDPVGR